MSNAGLAGLESRRQQGWFLLEALGRIFSLLFAASGAAASLAFSPVPCSSLHAGCHISSLWPSCLLDKDFVIAVGPESVWIFVPPNLVLKCDPQCWRWGRWEVLGSWRQIPHEWLGALPMVMSSHES